MNNELLNVKMSKDKTITSVELVEIINEFRKLESEASDKKYVELRHDNLKAKIEKEVMVLKNLGINALLNFKESSYVNSQNKSHPCYKLSKDGMLTILASESVLVRHKTIEYINSLEKQIEDNQRKLPSTYKDALLELVAQIEATEKLQLEVEQKNQVIGELQPKADYTDIILTSQGTMTVTQIAKDYGMSAIKLNKILSDNKVQYKQHGQWLLYSKYQSCGYTKSNTFIDGSGTSRLNTTWTQKGRLFINELLNKNNIRALIEKE